MTVPTVRCSQVGFARWGFGIARYPGGRLGRIVVGRLIVIGTLRRDCLDHVLIFSEQHLRQVLKSYALYYNEARRHLGLSKDTPPPRTIQCSRIISATAVLSGLHHRYARI